MNNIKTELDFENRIRDVINNDIVSQYPSLIVLDIQKTTDIVICRNGEDPQIFFIEVKYYHPSHGRLGFGHANGKGFQPEVLRKRPDFFKSNMRWIIGSMDSEEYFVADNNTILGYVSGGEIGYKHNNIQTKIFNEIQGLTKTGLCDELKNWIL
jgi:hypothetical protein